VRFQLVPAAYVVFLREGPNGAEVLLHLRQGTGYMDGHWATIAGHVEAGESVLAAAVREASEEVGVEIAEADLVPLTVLQRTQNNDDPIEERVDFIFTCRLWIGEPRRAELDKSAALGWFPLSDLPSPVVPHELLVLERLASGRPVPLVIPYGFGR
jgi:8-oxo-dGTP pyrophosphatase MutT (NUDIX family)